MLVGLFSTYINRLNGIPPSCVFNRPGVAGAVLQSASGFIHSFIQ